MDDRIEQSVEQATAGLKSDPELRLDVSAELRSHLDDTAQTLAAEGVGEVDAVEQALHAFGEPLELAGDLLEANKRRMTLRARVRLALQALLIPAAVLVALYFGYGGFARVVNFTKTFTFYSSTTRLPELPKWRSAQQRTHEERIERDLTRLRSHLVTPEEMRKLWQPYNNTPGSRAVYGYYTSLLNVPRIPRQGEAQSANSEDFERCMRVGKQIDPDNALYSYQLAQAYLASAMISREERVSGDEKGDEILDRQLFEQGVKELQLALAQPTELEYNDAMMHKRLKLLPPPRLTEDYLQRLTIISYEFLPFYSHRRSLARKTLGCARLLIAEGRMEEAKLLLEAWHCMPTQMLQETDTMIEILVATALASMLGEGTADTYDDIGQHDKAVQVRADTERLIAPVEVRKQQRDQWGNARIPTELQKHGSIFSVNYTPVFLGMRPYAADELAPMRYHEQTMVEELSLSVVLLLCALIMVGSMLTQVHWFLKLRSQ